MFLDGPSPSSSPPPPVITLPAPICLLSVCSLFCLHHPRWSPCVSVSPEKEGRGGHWRKILPWTRGLPQPRAAGGSPWAAEFLSSPSPGQAAEACSPDDATFLGAWASDEGGPRSRGLPSKFHQGLRIWTQVVLCLGLAIHTQEGLLPKPSIRAEPGPVIRRGRPVTIVCGGPAGADLFRLENTRSQPKYKDQKNIPQHGSYWTNVTFRTHTKKEFTAGSYFCRYQIGSSWSEPSETLELKVEDEDGSPPPSESSTSRAVPDGTGRTQTNSRDSESGSLLRDHLSIFVGISVASLLCLLLLALCLIHRQHQKKRGPPSSKGEEPRPQERLSPTVDLTESPADVATTVDTLPEENGDMHSPSPAAEEPQEVTYAQLDQRALTRRAARAETPQPTEPTAESSLYAALPGH